ncbi:MAG: HIT family protein [Candidatus Eisenbacteria bacterium]|nr:HIT family protein [Candidatus Eisenbacteria bacterium]
MERSEESSPEVPAPECAFCAIVEGERPASVVFETERLLAFLDHRPLFPGHVLLIPRRHVPTIADLPEDLAAPFLLAMRDLATAVEESLGAQGAFLAVNHRVSQSVPHLHAHIVPRRRGDGLKGFFWPRNPYENDAQREEIAARIRAALARVSSPPARRDPNKTRSAPPAQGAA